MTGGQGEIRLSPAALSAIRDRWPDSALTPRTAAVLYNTLLILADEARDDIAELGDGPPGPASLFGLYPRFTHRCDRTWRQRAARAYEDLAQDIGAGVRPAARCPAEEMALHLAVPMAADLYRDDPGIFDLAGLPQVQGEFDFEAVLEELLLDEDMALLLDPAWDGVEDPSGDWNRWAGVGDYRPERWFDVFDCYPPRDHGHPSEA